MSIERMIMVAVTCDHCRAVMHSTGGRGYDYLVGLGWDINPDTGQALCMTCRDRDRARAQQSIAAYVAGVLLRRVVGDLESDTGYEEVTAILSDLTHGGISREDSEEITRIVRAHADALRPSQRSVIPIRDHQSLVADSLALTAALRQLSAVPEDSWVPA